MGDVVLTVALVLCLGACVDVMWLAADRLDRWLDRRRGRR